MFAGVVSGVFGRGRSVAAGLRHSEKTRTALRFLWARRAPVQRTGVRFPHASVRVSVPRVRTPVRGVRAGRCPAEVPRLSQPEAEEASVGVRGGRGAGGGLG